MTAYKTPDYRPFWMKSTGTYPWGWFEKYVVGDARPVHAGSIKTYPTTYPGNWK